MVLAAGTRVGSYEVLAHLASGGMGDVYRAHDSKLGRDVALKIVPQMFTTDPDRLARFEREARTLAALNHPNIAQVYDAGRTADGLTFLAMEFVAGRTLDELQASHLELRDVVAITRQIATALEAAHEQGIIHRDLKPANVKVRDDGTVKVLDFGLAKVVEGDSSASGLSAATMTSPAMTQQGIILGTAAYMSPEQAKGRPVDKRADIWAFGCVLREMLTGQSLFAGESVGESLGKVFHQPILDSDLPARTPPALRHLIARCLDRDPATRLRDIGEARIALSGPDVLGESLGPANAVRPRLSAPVVAGALGLAAVTALAAWILKPGPPLETSSPKLDIIARGFEANLNPNFAPSLSPDGTRVLYRAAGSLYVRSLDRLDAELLTGTENAEYLTWSPDSRRIAFVQDAQIFTTSVGSVPTRLAAVPPGMAGSGGLAWNEAGEIAVSGSADAGLISVTAGAGVARTILPIDPQQESDFHEISALPGPGGWLIAVHRLPGTDTIAVITDGRRKDVLTIPGETLRSPIYSATGHVLFQRAQTNHGIWAVPFSLDRLETTGEPFMVLAGAWQPSISSDGDKLAFVRKPETVRQFVWVTRSGAMQPVGDPAAITTEDTERAFRLGPDGVTVAYSTFEGGPPDLWTLNLDRGTRTRLTGRAGASGGAGAISPVFTHDGQRVMFAAFMGQVRWNIYARRADAGSDIATVVKDDDFVLPLDISRDGKWLVYAKGTTDGKILARPLDGPGDARVLVGSGVARGSAVLSPDGRWLAYSVNETGTNEIFVRPFPEGEGRWPISTGGGSFPLWSHDGRELLYRSRDRIMTVSISAGADRIEPGTPRPLFTASADNGLTGSFQLSRDGQRLLMVRTSGEDRLTLVFNLPAELRRLTTR